MALSALSYFLIVPWSRLTLCKCYMIQHTSFTRRVVVTNICYQFEPATPRLLPGQLTSTSMPRCPCPQQHVEIMLTEWCILKSLFSFRLPSYRAMSPSLH